MPARTLAWMPVPTGALKLFHECSQDGSGKFSSHIAAQGLSKFAEGSAKSLSSFTPDCTGYCAADLLCGTLFGVLSPLRLPLCSSCSLRLFSGLFFCLKGFRFGFFRFRSFFNAASLQEFIGRIRIVGLVIFGVENTALYALLSLGIRDRSHPALGRKNGCLGNNCRNTAFIQERDQGFAGSQCLQRIFGIESRVFTEGLRSCTDCLLVFGRIGAERVLYAVAQLSQNRIRYISGNLCAEIDADAFRADQSHDLLDFFQEDL